MGKRITQEEFISRIKKIYGDKYNYSKVKYNGYYDKITVTCKKHGDFLILPSNFLKGHGCQICSGRERITKDVFIARSIAKHNNRYDYSKVDYKRADFPVTIICPIHGEFKQIPKYHLNGNGCQKCFATPKLTTEEFITNAKSIYKNKYEYKKVDYKGNKQKVIITCPIHGDWTVTPNNFLRGSECPECFGTPKKTTEQFILDCEKIHGTKYDYSKASYDGNKNKVTIICPIHGEFSQTAQSHLNGAGCPVCSNTQRITKDIFIDKSKLSHAIKYDYSNVDFSTSVEKVKIICPKHGPFWQTVRYHMHGGNCPKCVGGVRLAKEEFVEKARKVHKNKYDYSKVEYKNTSTKVRIVCPKHGEFWQTPNSHLFGAGCPSCPQSDLEGAMRNFLIKNNIVFKQEFGPEWLIFKRRMYLDFYLPELNVAIECQGKQHFAPVDLFGGEEFFNKTIARDQIKKKLCEEHGIKLLYFSNANIDYPYDVIETYDELSKELDIVK